MEPITSFMPVKNGLKYLSTSIFGIMENCRPEDEVLIIDNGSEDGSLKSLLQYEMEFANLRVISAPKLSFPDVLNLGLKESSNTWVARFDVDDLYSPLRLETQRSLISNNVAAIFSDYSVFFNDKRYAGRIPTGVDSTAVVFSLLFSQQTAHPSALIDKSALLSIGGYRSADFPAEDLSAWLRLSRVGKLISSPKVLLNYRLSSSSITAQRRPEGQNRTAFLLKNIGIPIEKLDTSIENLYRTRDSYKEMESFGTRYLLHLRNINRAIVYHPDYFIGSGRKFPSLKLSALTHSISALELLYYQYIRNSHRSEKSHLAENVKQAIHYL
jgi:glycosyltransferase involved in cell wall biosynthesis